MPARTYHSLTILATPLAALVLGACAASYERREAPNDARLRLSQQGLMMTKPYVVPIDASGACGKRFSTDSLIAPAVESSTAPPPSLTGPGGGAGKPVRQAREAMLDSPPAERTDVIELRLPPGRYAISETGMISNGTSVALAFAGVSRHCGMITTISLNPGDQYWVQLSGDNSGCRTQHQRVEVVDGSARWMPAVPVSHRTQECK